MRCTRCREEAWVEVRRHNAAYCGDCFERFFRDLAAADRLLPGGDARLGGDSLDVADRLHELGHVRSDTALPGDRLDGCGGATARDRLGALPVERHEGPQVDVPWRDRAVDDFFAALLDALKSGRLPAVVATSSLELGIDIGHVDLVCQIGSPRRIATFLQRVGRSGHTVGGMPKGRGLPAVAGAKPPPSTIRTRLAGGSRVTARLRASGG